MLISNFKGYSFNYSFEDIIKYNNEEDKNIKKTIKEKLLNIE